MKIQLAGFSGENKIGLDVLALAVWMFHGFCELDAFFPTSLVKVACFGVMFLYFCISKTKIVLGLRYFMTFLTFVLYYILNAIIRFGVASGLAEGFQIMSWWLILMFSMLRVHSKQEIKFLMNAIKYACLISSLVMLFNNELFSSKIIYSLWDGVTMNRNYIADFTTPGLLITAVELIADKHSVLNWLIAAVFMLACLQPNSRTMFVILLAMLMVLVLYYARRSQTRRSVRIFLVAVFFVLILLLVLYFTLPESYISRLWTTEAYTVENSSRVDLWKKAINNMHNPIFGMGPGYNQKTLYTGYGAHNMFVDLYCDAGIVGLIFALVLVRFFIRSDLVVIFLLVIPAFRTLLESGRSISVWAILVVLAMMLVKSDCEDTSVEEIALNL